MIRFVLAFLALVVALPAQAQFCGKPGFCNVKASATPTTAWNPLDKNSNVNLSNANLTATMGGSSFFSSFRAVASHNSGKYYYEMLIGTFSSPTGQAVGIANASAPLGGSLSPDGNTAVWVQSTSTTSGGTSQTMNGVTYTAGDIVSIAVDIGNSKIWFRVNGGNWMGDVTANPATNAGGASMSGVSAGPYFPVGTVYDNGSFLTANFGATAYSYAVPSGFGNW